MRVHPGRSVAVAVTCLILASSSVRLDGERLPGNVVPEHYELALAPDLTAERFAGETRIRVNVLARTSAIVLHAAGLAIEAATIRTGADTHRATVSTNREAQTITLQAPVPLAPGRADIHITYSGPLTRELRGFYISEARGRKYAVTQLQATDARRMFPSFDEPRYKATFDVQATVDAKDTAISNGAVESITSAQPGKRTFDFATTPPMSTYLVALAVGDFECVRQRVGTTPLGVCATPGNEHLTRFAMDAARAALGYLNDYFAIDYPFGKLDLVALPDFAAGAMENTGAVFFRESLLLVDEHASLSTRKRAAAVIAHELAHMWFGNLVTMTWWDDLWLNEGFATWMETKVVGAWKPEWDMELDELQATHAVMVLDTRASTRPVRVAAETPAEIESLFDALSYEKAAAVIGMTESFAGEERWRAAVNAYLENHKYGNATATDFWSIATKLTHQPIDRVMSGFVDRPGVPLVTLETACEADMTRVTVRQEPFGETAAPAAPWPIPVCLETRGDAGADSCRLLDTAEGSITLPGCARWVVGNAGAEGYYRTWHGQTALTRLIRSNVALAADERLMLVADHWALVRSGHTDLTPFFLVTRALADDAREPAVLTAMALRLQFVHEYLTTAETRKEFERWVRELYSPSLALATQRLEHTDTTRARHAALLGLVGAVGRDPSLMAKAREAVEAYLTGRLSTPVAGEVMNAYVGLAALSGDDRLYELYRTRAENAATPEERYRFLYALASFRDAALIRRTLEYARSPRVRAQDRALLLGRILSNPAARPHAWQDIQAHWAELQKGLGAFGGLTRIVEGLAAFCDRKAATDIRTFFDSQDAPPSPRTLAQTLETIESCAALADAQRSRLQDALDASAQTVARGRR